MTELELLNTFNNSNINSTLNIASLKFVLISLSMIAIPLYIFGIMGNVTLITAIIKFRKFHTTSFIIAANIAFSDILLLLTSIFFVIFNICIISNVHIPLSIFEEICKLNYIISTAAFLNSSHSFVAISIDRYLNVIRRNKLSLLLNNVKFLLLVLVMIWLSSIGIAIPVSFISTINPAFPYICDLNPRIASKMQMSSYVIFLIIIVYIIPLLTVFYFYSSIFSHIKSRIIDSNLSRSPSNRSYRQVNAAKMMAAVTLLFMLSNLPICIIWIFLAVSDQSLAEFILNDRYYIYALASIAVGITNTNSIQNPVIYAIYNKNMRSAMLSTVSKK